MPDIIAKFEDGVAERLVDEEYANMIEDFPRQQLFRQIHALEARQRNVKGQSLMLTHTFLNFELGKKLCPLIVGQPCCVCA